MRAVLVGVSVSISLLLLLSMMQYQAVHKHAHARACVTRKEAAEARESSSPPFFHRALETVLTWGGVGDKVLGEGWRIRGWS